MTIKWARDQMSGRLKSTPLLLWDVFGQGREAAPGAGVPQWPGRLDQSLCGTGLSSENSRENARVPHSDKLLHVCRIPA